jgi:hypothetical protein
MRVFISHSSEDKARLDDVCYALEHNGITLWKPDETATGQALSEELRSVVESCVVCVFLATRNSLASARCQAEMGAFWGAGKPVIVYLDDDKLNREDLPKQFQPDKRVETTRQVVDAVKLYLREAAEAMLIRKRPANVFWLGHDLARAVRFAKFEPDNRNELDAGLRQALHQLDEIRLPAPNARKLLLSALKRYRSSTALSEREREEFVRAITIAKNDIGSRIAHLQPGFKGHATREAQNRLNQEVEGLVNPNR